MQKADEGSIAKFSWVQPIRDDLPIRKGQDALRAFGDMQFVRHQDDGCLFYPMQFEHEFDDVVAVF